jgi:hypothetical protein
LRGLASPITEPNGGERNLENEYYEGMKAAGLVEGSQLRLKLESFQSVLVAFQAEGGEERLEEALDAGETILKGLAGAIPIFGSSAEELIEFILQELRKRWWRRRRR